MPTHCQRRWCFHAVPKIPSTSTATTNECINILPFEHSDPFVDARELLQKILIPASLIASQRSGFPLVQRMLHFAETLPQGQSLLLHHPFSPSCATPGLKSPSWILSPCQCAGTSYGCKVRATASNIKRHPDTVSCKTQCFKTFPDNIQFVKLLHKTWKSVDLSICLLW